MTDRNNILTYMFYLNFARRCGFKRIISCKKNLRIRPLIAKNKSSNKCLFKLKHNIFCNIRKILFENSIFIVKA